MRTHSNDVYFENNPCYLEGRDLEREVRDAMRTPHRADRPGVVKIQPHTKEFEGVKSQLNNEFSSLLNHNSDYLLMT